MSDLENHEAGSHAGTATPRTASSSHSPAPWVVRFGKSGYPRAIEAPHEMQTPGAVGHIVRWNGIGCPSSPTAQANARLIAAAPDMLAALREVEWIFDGQEDITDNGNPNDAMKALAVLRAAITKATGAA